MTMPSMLTRARFIPMSSENAFQSNTEEGSVMEYETFLLNLIIGTSCDGTIISSIRCICLSMHACMLSPSVWP